MKSKTTQRRTMIRVGYLGIMSSGLPYYLCVLGCLVGLVVTPSAAQTVIGGSTPDTSAVLDVQSTSKGVLFPRLTTAQRDAIANPAQGLMVYNATTKCLEINLGTPSSPDWSDIKCAPAATIGALDCTNAALTGTLTADSVATGVSVQVPYTGGDGGTHSGQTVTSTGVTGLTATLTGGSFANGADSLTYTISGTPDSAGTASFALNIGGQSCTLELTVGAGGGGSAPTTSSWAMVSATDTLYFMDHNLGAANTSADPLTPSWEIIAGYWQWGRKGPDASQWLNTNTPNFAHGPTGSGAGEANDAAVSGWSSTDASNGAWSDASKTADDPCPAGFRVPTKAQWDGVLANNTLGDIGSWHNNATNYSSGKSIGSNLMLPAAGNRDSTDGTLFDRGHFGYYWSSTEYLSIAAWYLSFDSGNAYTNISNRKFGFSVRCAAE